MIKRFWEVILEVFKSIGVILLFLLIPTCVSKPLRQFIHSDNFWFQNISLLLCYMALAIVLFILYHKRLIEDFKKFKSKNIEIGIKYWLLGCLIMIISNGIIFYFVKRVK